MSHLTHVRPIRTRQDPGAVVALVGGLPFAVDPPVDVRWPDPLWFLGRELVVPGPVLFALAVAEVA